MNWLMPLDSGVNNFATSKGGSQREVEQRDRRARATVAYADAPVMMLFTGIERDANGVGCAQDWAVQAIGAK